MTQTTLNGDYHINGQLTAQRFRAPVGSLGDSAIEASANISASKLQLSARPILEQESGTTAFTERRVVHVVRGATANVEAFLAGSVVANIGGATITIDLLKNGASILDEASPAMAAPPMRYQPFSRHHCRMASICSFSDRNSSTDISVGSGPPIL